jgi:hypothetical protein
MKVILVSIALLIGLPCLGFFLQWLRWQAIPTVKDKVKAKRKRKANK